MVREGTNIVISLPGKNTQGVLDNIGKTALLSIRQVYESNDPSMTGRVGRRHVADRDAVVRARDAGTFGVDLGLAVDVGAPHRRRRPPRRHQRPARRRSVAAAPQAEPAGFVRAASSAAASAAAAPTSAAPGSFGGEPSASA